MKPTPFLLTLLGILALSALASSADLSIPPSPKEIAETRVGAERGNAAMQFNLGAMYALGKGVPKDDTEAMKWYRKSADQGYAGGQCRLGLMYAKGQGVPKNDAEAVRWIRKAAEQGDAEGQRLLGFNYAGGNGVPKDDTESYKWWLLAGAQGDEGGKEGIAILERNLTPAQRAEGQRMAREFKPR